jgi:hypothetical protein
LLSLSLSPVLLYTISPCYQPFSLCNRRESKSHMYIRQVLRQFPVIS